LFLFLLSALFLLRIALRQFAAELFHEPPRNTRWAFRHVPWPGETETTPSSPDAAAL
jgi:hypothetical protein